MIIYYGLYAKHVGTKPQLEHIITYTKKTIDKNTNYDIASLFEKIKFTLDELFHQVNFTQRDTITTIDESNNIIQVKKTKQEIIPAYIEELQTLSSVIQGHYKDEYKFYIILLAIKLQYKLINNQTYNNIINNSLKKLSNNNKVSKIPDNTTNKKTNSIDELQEVQTYLRQNSNIFTNNSIVKNIKKYNEYLKKREKLLKQMHLDLLEPMDIYNVFRTQDSIVIELTNTLLKVFQHNELENIYTTNKQHIKQIQISDFINYFKNTQAFQEYVNKILQNVDYKLVTKKDNYKLATNIAIIMLSVIIVTLALIYYSNTEQKTAQNATLGANKVPDLK